MDKIETVILRAKRSTTSLPMFVQVSGMENKIEDGALKRPLQSKLKSFQSTQRKFHCSFHGGPK